MELLPLVVLGVALSAVSLYYYLQVLKQIYVRPEPKPAAPEIPGPFLARFAVLLIVMAMIVLGIAPGLLVDVLTGGF